MAQKLTAALPPDFDLPPNFIVRVTAVSPTTGADNTGVNVSNVTIMAAPITPGTSDETAAVLPSLFVPIDINHP